MFERLRNIKTVVSISSGTVLDSLVANCIHFTLLLFSP